MAKQTWNNPIDKSVDWGGDVTTGGLPVSGEQVQKFIKETFDKKAGVFYYDNTNNRYLVFADAEARDKYLLDPTQTELVLGTFDAPFNYTAEINLTSAAYNAVFLGSTGNYIDFTFDVKNKQGASTGENVTVTYTFIRNAVRKTVTETRKFGDAVHFNVDKYLGEGTNTVIVGVTGQTSLAATTVAITYQVVNLVITDETDISKAYNLVGGAQTMEVPFTVSGYGTKVVEWYLDGELLSFVKAEDEIVDVSATRTKYITLSNLQQGRHSLQIRAYTVINGENFYTDTLYRDIIIYTGANNEVIIGVAVTIPRLYGVLGATDPVAIYNMVQYVPYLLRFATYSPSNASNTEVTIALDGVVRGSINSSNGVENRFVLTSKTSGNKVLTLTSQGVSKEMAVVVEETDMNIQEIQSGLVLDFSADGKSNNSLDRDQWSFGNYVGTLTGFNWNNSSGWVNGRLEMNAGSSFGINYAPLSGNPTDTGKTIEIEWSTKNVTNDNAVICDLRGDNGAGILITATKVSLISADGVRIETEYKSDENVRIGFVINKASGVTNQHLSFIYANGIVSRGETWAITDSYASYKEILFTATEEAEISLKAIRIYDAALSSDNMFNNYTLYRDTIAEMMEVYDRNDVYEEGTVTFSPEKMMGRLPVMIVTGDIPILENTSDKDTQIVVDIEYYNMQDSSRNFTMKNAAMRPQGTSSMGYPKKNFRIYTEKVANTVLYDANGNVVEDKLYAFKSGAQPVNCWCLKADYAESSGTHNTGIARLWNEALFNAQIDGEYKLRTEAQKKAVEANYPYDVRTTIDGFPILLFYRPTVNDDVIFIGKYNFNNDKSTESVFGFEGIPNFNNEKMQCWEVLNNGNPLALFTTMDGFDEGWAEAFESRYPDTKTPYTGDLKAFCQWMTTVSQADFVTQKWEHLNVYMMAAYWCYLMRHAGADQFVKNAMFTSEDGIKWYYILYDNDTINGLINTGRLRIKPTDGRQTVDESGSYVFAGHDSRLWNMLEADKEFIDIVSVVDNALYSAGISYANTIRIFDEEQADKWVERVYNQDAQYKYVGPYTEKGINNLFMLQGKRDLHRRWWLAKRFSIYDAKYVSGTYKSQAVEIKCLNGTEAGQQFTIVAGYPIDYGYGINNVPRSFGIALEVGESHTFTTEEVINLGDPLRIYGAPNIAEIDFSQMADRLAVVNIANVYDESLGTKLRKLVLGNSDLTNTEVTEISGLKQAILLEELDVQGMTKMLSLDLSNHAYFKTLKAWGSGAASVTLTKGASVERLELPAAMRVLLLEQLPYLTTDGIAFENIANLAGMTIVACPNLSNDFNVVYNWVDNKTTADASCSLIMDNINWSGISGEQMARIASIGANGGTISLKGKVVLTDITEEQGAIFEQVFGDTVFNENAEFYIDAPTTVTISGPTSVLEGNSATYVAKVYPPTEGTLKYSLATTRKGASINATTGVLTTTENGLATSNIVVRATFTPSNGEPTITRDYTVSVVKRTYPTNATINGNDNPIVSPSYTWSTTTSGVNGSMTATWSLSGDIVDYMEIDSSNLNGCSIDMAYPPLGIANGTLTLTLKKAYNGATILTITKALSAELEGVIITGRSNAPIQTSLYNAGLVKHETYTLESEAKAITAAQLQTGTTATTSIFYAQRANITSFDEFQYFTGITTILQRTFQDCTVMTSIKMPNTVTGLANYAFQNCSALVDIEFSTALKNVGASTFANCANLKEVVFLEGFTTTGSNTFINCPSLERIYFPASTTTIGENVFMGCGKLNIEVAENNPYYCSVDGVLFNKQKTKLMEYAKEKLQPVYEVPSGVTYVGNYAFYSRQQMTSITFPSTLTRLGSDVLSMCPNLSSLIFNCVNAPSTDNASVFGATNNAYTGRNTYSAGTNRLRIPLNATGYEAGLFLDPLQNASKSGFSIHGKLTIASNRSDAQFDIKYTTEANTSKTITVGVGTCYLNDIKYGTSLTATPKALGSFIFDSASTTITYNGAATITNNAYIYPKDATIMGASNPCENATYTWSTTTTGVTGAYTAVWSLSDSLKPYMSIGSQDNTKCAMNISEEPINVVNGTLALTLKKNYDGSILLTTTKNIALRKIIRPTSLSINGDGTIYYKDYTHTYTLQVSPNNVNVTYSTNWSLSNTTNVQIVSSTNTSCTIKVLKETSTSNVSFTLSATVKTTDGVTTVTQSKNITLAKVVRPTSLSFTTGDSQVRFVGNYNYIVAPNVTPTNVSLTYNTPTLSGNAVTQGKVSLLSSSNGTTVISVNSESTSDLTFTINQSATVSGGGATISGSKTVTLKSVIRPTSVTISGESNIKGGDTSTYTATISPSTTNVDVTYTWSISGSSNATIASQSGNQCTVNTTTPEAEENFTLTCVVKSVNGAVTVQDTHGVKLMPKPNFITATYNVTSTTSATKLIHGTYPATYMEIDGVKVQPVYSYTFSSTGYHTVKFSKENLHACFIAVPNLTSVDFSLFDGTSQTSLNSCFDNCSALTSIEWGECTFPNVKSLNSAFSYCSKLTSIDLSPFAGAPITDLDKIFDNCSALTSIEWGECTFPNVKSLSYAFSYCSKLTSIDLSPFAGAPITNLTYTFTNCSALTSIDLSPFADAPITNFSRTFNGCAYVKTLIFPWITAPKASYDTFGSGGTTYVGYYTRTTGKNKLLVPYGSTGYDSDYWLDPLQKSSKCGFTLDYTYVPTECTSLTITADDVSGGRTTTTIHYIAITNGIDSLSGETLTGVEVTGTATSEAFPQNTSYTKPVKREVSFTYMGVTATTTITQGVWVDSSYTLDLNDGQWELSTTLANPDSSIYDGVYQSVKSKGVNNGFDTMYIDIMGYNTFNLYIRSYAEGNYDYVMVSQLDKTITGSTSYSDTTLVKAHTRGKQSSSTAISGYTLVEFTGINSGGHRITVVYRKDSSSNSNDDRGYVLIPKEQ